MSTALALKPRTGGDFPKRNVAPGAGRVRQPNPFDEHLQNAYDSRSETNGILRFPASQVGKTDDERKHVVSLARASADYLGYGLDVAWDDDENLVLRVREKRVVNRKPRNEN